MLFRLTTVIARLTAILAFVSCAGAAPAAIPRHEGQHDFDFDLGTWKTEITRRVHPLTASTEIMRLSGTVTVRQIWAGKGQIEEIEADGPAGHWEGLTVFLYDRKSAQWSMNFANGSVGKFTAPMIGGFRNGKAELVGTDTVGGQAILVKAVWSELTPRTHTYQEFYSSDGGHSWELAFAAHKTRQ